jgi:hypothetical protein
VSAPPFLKPCPFCGGAATDPQDSAAIYCDNRECRVNPSARMMRKQGAIAAWNTRADSGLVAALSQLLRDIEPMEQAAGVRTASGDAARAALAMAMARGEGV